MLLNTRFNYNLGSYVITQMNRKHQFFTKMSFLFYGKNGFVIGITNTINKRRTLALMIDLFANFVFITNLK